MEDLPSTPKLFFCKNCKVYFWTNSQLKKPTHPKCAGHNTELCDRYTIQIVETINKICTTPKKER